MLKIGGCGLFVMRLAILLWLSMMVDDLFIIMLVMVCGLFMMLVMVQVSLGWHLYSFQALFQHNSIQCLLHTRVQP
jgi:hypothetical protein